jgi:REP element-mobilizing transposase RayT
MKREFNEDHTPLAYLITFRCYGTWLHGEGKGSVDRHHNRYGAPVIAADPRWHRHNLNSLKEDPVKLIKAQRATVTAAIKNTCGIRKWTLYAVNARTNHCHVVVNGGCGPGRILNALKGNATRELRKTNQWCRSVSPWADGGSKRYLWTEVHLQRAIDYVELEQGDVFPNIDDIF